MFLHLSVSHSVHRGGVLSQHALQVVSHHALQQVYRGVPVSGRSALGRVCSRGEVCSGVGSAHRGVPAPGGSALGGLLRGVGLLQGGACSQGIPAPGGGICSREWVWRPPQKADGYCCGRYASYWMF